MTFPQNNPITDTLQTGPALVEVSGDQQSLEKVRSLIPEISSVSVPEITGTRPSLTIKFDDQDEAEFFEEKLSSEIQNKALNAQAHVVYDTLSHPGNVYVRGFGFDCTTDQLVELFSQYGPVLACKIVTDPVLGRSKGFGFVNFALGHAAKDAIEALSGKEWQGNTLYLNRHISKKERIARLRKERENFKNLYVKNIPGLASEKEILAEFEVFGEIESYFLPKRGHLQYSSGSSSGESLPRSNNSPNLAKNVSENGLSLLKGYGFVKYVSHDAAETAMMHLQGKEIRGHRIQISRAQRREERNMQDHRRDSLPMAIPMPVQRFPGFFDPYQFYPPANVYLSNFPPSADESIIALTFAPYGEILLCGISKGYGFVCFASPAQAAAAASAVNERLVGGKMVGVTYGYGMMYR